MHNDQKVTAPPNESGGFYGFPPMHIRPCAIQFVSLIGTVQILPDNRAQRAPGQNQQFEVVKEPH